jgi:hypothetical protein
VSVQNWENYDPTWLVELAREQTPDGRWVVSALARCIRASWESRAHVHFINPDTDWEFVGNVMLHHRIEGGFLVDLSAAR